MEKIFTVTLVVVFSSMLLSATAWGQVTYYSQASGAPTTLTNWNTVRGGGGSSPTNFTTGDVFVIQNTHTMTTTAAWSISGTGSKLWIENGGVLVAASGFAVTLATATTFQIDDGGTYIHSNTAAFGTSIFQGTESFSSGSTVEFTDWNSTGPIVSTWGNVRFNATGAVASVIQFSGNLTTINGNLEIIATGTGTVREVRLSTTQSFTLTIAGNLNISGGILEIASAAGTSAARTLNIGGSFNQTGGTFKCTGTSDAATINFTGSGKTFTQSAGTLTNTNMNWTINSSASLTLANNLPVATSRTLTVNGTLNCGTNLVTGAGAFTLASAATLGIGSVDGITSTASTGNIQVSGTRTYDVAANFTYNGSSAQVTGNQLPSTVNNLTVSNSAGVTLSSSTQVNGTLTLTSGNIALGGNTLTLGSSTSSIGTLSWTSGFLTGSGSFTRWFNTSAVAIGNVAGLFPFGVSTNNRNVWVAGTPTTGGTVSVQYADGSGATQPFTSGSFSENAQTFVNRSNASWTVATANSFAGTSLSLRIQGTGLTGINAVGDLNISGAAAAASGTYAAPGGTTTDPQINRTGLDQTGLASTFYFASTSASPLPVELTSFTAITRGNKVELVWKTASEVNNYGFEVERNAVRVSGFEFGENSNHEPQNSNQAWVRLGFVEGHGTTNAPQNYSFTDNSVAFGKYSYRLKQIDRDGKFEYSGQVEVMISQIPQMFALMQNHPNPFNPTTNFRFTISDLRFVSLNIYDVLGREVATLMNEKLNAGAYTVQWDASGFPSGIYFYRLNAGNFVETKKMLMVK